MKTIIISVPLTLATSGPVSAMDSLSGYGWKNRVLVLFGGSTDQEMKRQVAILSAQESWMAERDMVVLQVSTPQLCREQITCPVQMHDGMSLSRSLFLLAHTTSAALSRLLRA